MSCCVSICTRSITFLSANRHGIPADLHQGTLESAFELRLDNDDLTMFNSSQVTSHGLRMHTDSKRPLLGLVTSGHKKPSP